MGLIELEAQKVEANALMESQNYAKAAALYSAIVSQLHTTEKNGSRDNEVLSDGKRLCIACLNNLSMAYQKMGEHGQCIDSCSSSIVWNLRCLIKNVNKNDFEGNKHRTKMKKGLLQTILGAIF